MKFSRNTLAVFAACSAITSAAPLAQQSPTDQSLAISSASSEVMMLVNELSLIHQKRSLAVGADEIAEFDKRADSVVGQLLVALSNSGVIGDVWTAFHTDPALRSLINAILISSLQTMMVQGPALLRAIYESGLLSKLFGKFLNDAGLRSAFLSASLEIINMVFGMMGSVPTPAAPVGASPSAPVGGGVPPAASKPTICKRDDGAATLSASESKEIAELAVEQIKLAGLVGHLIRKAIMHPVHSVKLIASALKNSVVLLEEIYYIAKVTGLLDLVLKQLASSGQKFAGSIAEFLKHQIDIGSVDMSEIEEQINGMVALISNGTDIAATNEMPSVSTEDLVATPTPTLTLALLETIVERFGIPTEAPSIAATGIDVSSAAWSSVISGAPSVNSAKFLAEMQALFAR